jgi:4-oxalocrotonate tautomerase
MPHIVVKMLSGRSEQQKAKLAQEIVKTVTSTLKCDDKWVSVGIEDVAASDWTAQVYRPEIEANWDKLYKKPSYEPF